MEKQNPPLPVLHVVPAFLRACYGIDLSATVLLLGAALLLALNFDAIHGCADWYGLLIGGSLLAGIVEKYYSLRVRFDVHLFDAISEERLNLSSLDEGLKHLFPASAPASGRDWDIRVRGAMGLARRQLAAFSLQALLFTIAAVSTGACR